MSGHDTVEILTAPPGARAADHLLLEEVVPRVRAGTWARVAWVVRTAARRRALLARCRELSGRLSAPRCFFTLREIADRLWPLHPDFLPVATTVQRRLLLARAVRDALEGLPPGEKRAELERVGVKAGFLDHLAHLFDELAELGDPSAARAALEKAPRSRELVAVLDAFRSRLDTARLVTEGARYHAVSEGLDDGRLTAGGDQNLLIFEGLRQPSAAEKRLVRCLARLHGRTVVVADILGSPERPLAADEVYTDLLELFPDAKRSALPDPHDPRAAAEVARRFFAPARTPLAADGSLQAFSASSPVAEVERIAATIRDAVDQDPSLAQNLSRIVVAFPEIDRYAAIVRDVFPRWGIPFELLRGHDLVTSPLVRAAFALLEIPAREFARAAAERAFGSPYVRFRGAGGRSLEPRTVDRLARAARVVGGSGRGRREWAERLALHHVELAAERAALEANVEVAGARRMGALERDLHLLDIQVPILHEAFDALANLQSGGAPEELARRVRSVLERFELSRTIFDLAREGGEEIVARDAEAWSALLRALAEVGQGLGLAGERWVSLPAFLAALRLGALGEGFYVTSPDRAARVVVLRLQDLHGVLTRHLFLGGLSHDGFPPRGRADLFLGEAARTSLGLDSGARRQREARYLFGLALAGPAERTVLSFAGGTRSDELESTYLREVRRHLETLPEPPPAVAVRCERERQVRVARAVPEDSRAALACEGTAQTADILAALAMEQARVGPLGPYDGLLSPEAAAHVAAGPLGPSHVFSVSQLERYATCPFRFFAERVLGLETPPEPEVEANASTRGSLVHEILVRFSRAEREEGHRLGPGWLAGAWPRMERVAAHVLAALGGHGDVFTRRFVTSLVRGLDGQGRPGVLRLFLEREAEARGCFPAGRFEATFGQAGTSTDVLADDPVEVAPGVRVAGAIDRLDLPPESTDLYLYDYKTGAALPLASDLREGVRLQIALYLVIAAKLFPDRQPRGGAYYLVREGSPVGPQRPLEDRSRGRDLPSRLSDALAWVPGAVSHMAASARAGRFHPGHLPPERKGCESCDLWTVCRVDHGRMGDLAEAGAPDLFVPLPLWTKR